MLSPWWPLHLNYRRYQLGENGVWIGSRCIRRLISGSARREKTADLCPFLALGAFGPNGGFCLTHSLIRTRIALIIAGNKAVVYSHSFRASLDRDRSIVSFLIFLPIIVIFEFLKCELF